MSELLNNYGRSASDPPSTTGIWRGKVTNVGATTFNFIVPRLTGVYASYTAETTLVPAQSLDVDDDILVAFTEGRNDEFAVLGRVNGITDSVVTNIEGSLTISGDLTVDGTIDATHINSEFDGPVVLSIKNTSGSTIAKGTPVYATGAVGSSGAVEVSPSRADTAGTMPALGITQAELAHNGEGHAVVLGVIDKVNTSAYTINDELYVAPSGGLVNVRPSGSNELVQKIGRVVRVNASTGEILVLGAGRTNDVPNGTLPNDISGNAATATALETARTINGTSFDGTANITVTASAGTLTGNTLSSGVTASSLTSVGTLSSLTVSGSATSDSYRWGGTGYLTSTTTSALKTELRTRDVFDSYFSAFKTGWSYAGNGDLTDAGGLTELAGTSWLTWTDNSTDNVQGNMTALVIAPNTGGSAGGVFIYNDQGSSYSPGWREVWTSATDGAGSGLDADTVDGLQASSFLRSNAADTATGLITFSGGINGFTLANGISGNNFNITGVNQIQIADPGEGIQWAGGASGTKTLYVIDDATDDVLHWNGSKFSATSYSLNGLTLTRADSDGSMRVQGNSGYIDVGPKNSAWCHIYTDMPGFYFNKDAHFAGTGANEGGEITLENAPTHTIDWNIDNYANILRFFNSALNNQDVRMMYLNTTTGNNTVRWNSNGSLLRYTSLTEKKEDIEDIGGILGYLNERNPLYDLSPKIFHEKDGVDANGEATNTTRGEYIYGMLAEDVYEVLPEICHTDGKGSLSSFGIESLIPLLVAEIQRLGGMVETLYQAHDAGYTPPVPRPASRADAEKAVFQNALPAEREEYNRMRDYVIAKYAGQDRPNITMPEPLTE